MLSFCHVNVTSIAKHSAELLARFSDYDVISVNETNLKSERKFSLNGYNVFRNDRVDKSGGGVLLAVKQHIQCREIASKTSQGNEMIAVQVEMKAFKPILIASIYAPPYGSLNIDLLRELHQINSECIIMGDLNAKLALMGSRKTNGQGRQLLELINEGSLHCVEDASTTFEQNDYEEKLDWILASQPLFAFISNVETHPTLGAASGHKPLTFVIPFGPDPKPPSPRISYNFKAANWKRYRSVLDEQLKSWNKACPTEKKHIDEYAGFITNCITAATGEAVPTSKSPTTNIRLSEATQRLITSKHQAYRRWKKTGECVDKHQYYNSKVLLANSLRNDKRNNFKKLMASLCRKTMYSEQVWLTVRKFHNKRIKQTFPNTISYNSRTATTGKEKADIFADYFANEVYFKAPDTSTFHRQVVRQANQVKKGIMHPATATKWNTITAKEVKWHIKQLRNSATGPDNVHNRCLKNHTKLLVQHLTELFNAVLQCGHIPDSWKTAHIILLLKPKKNKHQPSSYRPISLLSCLGKLLEKIVKQRLTLEIERRGILPQHQAGFRSKKSTIYNIVRLERYVTSQRHRAGRRRHSAVVFFDIKAAFDSVWHDGLIYKLHDLHLPRYIINYMVSFLHKRTAAIELDSDLSRPFVLKSGTPQGSPLSPLLYILYTADSMNGIPQHTEHGLFADDTALWTSSTLITCLSARLQESIDAFESWCKSWKLKLQPTKTEMIHFRLHPRKRYAHQLEIKVDNTTIEPVDAARYLGVIIDNQLNWRKHLRHIETRMAARIGLLRFLAKSAQEPNQRTMMSIFKSLARTVMIYGYPVLLTATGRVWDRLQIIQNRALRAALCLPSYTSVDYIHRITNIPKIKDYATTMLRRSIQTAANNNDNVLHKHLDDILHQL
jgi:exonuclease III